MRVHLHHRSCPMNVRTLLLTALLTALLAAASAHAQDAASIEPDTLGTTSNVHRAGDLFFSGQFAPDDIDELVARGITRVITLRGASELDWNEGAALAEAGIELIALPVRAPDTFTESAFHALRRELSEASGPTLLHCASAGRVGGLWIPYRVLDEGVAIERAVAEAKTIGLRNEAYEQRARAYVSRQLAWVSWPSVGIPS